MVRGNKIYVVVHGKKPGIYDTWNEASLQVHGFPGAVHKSFFSREEAQRYLERSLNPSPSKETEETTLIPYHGRTIAYTDGSADNKAPPGKKIGGYGVILISSNEIKEFRGPTPVEHGDATNNTAELYAIIVAIHNTQGPLTIRTDSEYSINCATVWVKDWISNGWKTTSGNCVANRPYIEFIYNALQQRDIKFEHVRGHSGDRYNERADALANEGRMMGLQATN